MNKLLTISHKRGLECRQCGCKDLKVLYTRKDVESCVKRRRECQKCGWRITTWERALGG